MIHINAATKQYSMYKTYTNFLRWFCDLSGVPQGQASKPRSLKILGESPLLYIRFPTRVPHESIPWRALSSSGLRWRLLRRRWSRLWGRRHQRPWRRFLRRISIRYKLMTSGVRRQGYENFYGNSFSFRLCTDAKFVTKFTPGSFWCISYFISFINYQAEVLFSVVKRSKRRCLLMEWS